MTKIGDALELLKNLKVQKPLVGIVVNPFMLGELLKLPDAPVIPKGEFNLRSLHHQFNGIPIFCKTTQKKDFIPFYNKKGMEKYLKRYDWVFDLRVVSADNNIATIGMHTAWGSLCG